MCRRSKTFACHRAKENTGTMQTCSFSNPKGDVCECGGNNINLSECKRDISRHVQTYGLGINRDEISDEMDLILELLNVRTICRYRYARKTKFNVGPCDFEPKHFNLVLSFPGYEIAQRLIFL